MHKRCAQAIWDRQMIKDLEKHLTLDTLHIDWRFNNKLKVLEKIKVVDKETENIIWNILKTDSFILDYALNENKFKKFERIESHDNYILVTNTLKNLTKTNDKVVLTWFSGQHTLFTDLKTFVDNWADFFYPSSDDLIVANENWDWIIYIAHFESFQFGQGIKTE